MSHDRIRIAGSRRLATLSMAGLLACGVACADPSLSPTDHDRIAREAARLKQAKGYAFFVVEHRPSGKFVQFAADDRGGLDFDYPLVFASTPAKEPTRDGQCSTHPPTPVEGESVRRLRSTAEEERLKSTLTAAGLPWQALYCLHLTREGVRRGYGLSITGRISDPDAVVRLVERSFLEAYGLPSLDGLNVVTDQDP